MGSSNEKSGTDDNSFKCSLNASLCFSETQNRLAEQLKALGHPSRLQIISLLKQDQPSCCGDLCDCVELAQSTVSQHLDVLRRAGIVKAQTCGTKTLFSLDQQSLASISDALEKI